MKKRYVFILVFITAFAQAQIVNIPDTDFKNALVNTDCVDTNGDGIGDSDADLNNDGEIQVSEAEAVLWLNVSNNYIHSLEGIQSFTSLEYLGCVQNQLTSLDVTHCPNLVNLLCLWNQITSLDVTQNPNLTKLDCHGNDITSLNLIQNPSLEYLNCFDNKLTSLDLTQNPNLKYLNCSINSITSLDVTQNPSLEELRCYDNQLTSLDVSQNPNIVGLDCSENSITSVDITQNPSIHFLSCQNNQLNSLNVKNGNSSAIYNLNANPNPNLTCIQVDDEVAANNNEYPYSVWIVHAQVTYSEECALGIEDNESRTFIMFPNPTQNVLNIQANKAVKNIKIFSLQGQLIKEASGAEIDVSALDSGIYFAKVSLEGKTLIKKFIKY